MVDAFDIMAFVVFSVLLAATVIVVVTFGRRVLGADHAGRCAIPNRLVFAVPTVVSR
jgi:hypothetical protein